MKMKKLIRLWIIVGMGIFFCGDNIFAMESGNNSGGASDSSGVVEVQQPDEEVPCHMQCFFCGELCNEAVQVLYTFKNKTYVVVFQPGCLAEKINELKDVFECPHCMKKLQQACLEHLTATKEFDPAHPIFKLNLTGAESFEQWMNDERAMPSIEKEIRELEKKHERFKRCERRAERCCLCSVWSLTILYTIAAWGTLITGIVYRTGGCKDCYNPCCSKLMGGCPNYFTSQCRSNCPDCILGDNLLWSALGLWVGLPILLLFFLLLEHYFPHCCDNCCNSCDRKVRDFDERVKTCKTRLDELIKQLQEIHLRHDVHDADQESAEIV